MSSTDFQLHYYEANLSNTGSRTVRILVNGHVGVFTMRLRKQPLGKQRDVRTFDNTRDINMTANGAIESMGTQKHLGTGAGNSLKYNMMSSVADMTACRIPSLHNTTTISLSCPVAGAFTAISLLFAPVPVHPSSAAQTHSIAFYHHGRGDTSPAESGSIPSGLKGCPIL